LRAALLHGVDAVTAWREWRSLVRLEALDPSAQWLLPLLYTNLKACGVSVADLRRYENVYRHNWYKNILLMSAASRILDRAGGNPAGWLLLRGAAWALDTYEDLGSRPVNHLDLYSPRSQWEPILRAFRSAGWRSSLRSESRMDFSDFLGRRVCLHGEVLSPSFEGEALSGAHVVRFREWEFRSFTPTHQLAHLAAGYQDWDDQSSLLWIADLAALLKKAPIDEAEFSASVKIFGVEPGWQSMRKTLRDVLGESFLRDVPLRHARRRSAETEFTSERR